MTEPRQTVLFRAITKLARAGEQAGSSVEEMIALLKTGVSVATLLGLVCCRLELSQPHIASVHLTIELAAHAPAIGD